MTVKCKHEIQHLVGGSDGILCKKCGRKFVNFAEIENDRKSENLGANPVEDGGIDKDIEKPKTEAVQPEDSPAKGSKASKTKAVSKPKKTEK